MMTTNDSMAVHQGHDAASRTLLSDPKRTGTVLKDHTPELDEVVALDSLTTHDGILYGEALEQGQTDGLFGAKFRDGRAGFVMVLMEHKSRPDLDLPLQLMHYRVLIWRRRDRRKWPGRQLPPIVCVVLYNGKAKWKVVQRIEDMIDLPEALFATLRLMGYFLIDLSQIPYEKLSGNPDLRAGLGALKLAYMTRGVKTLLDKVLDGLDRMQDDLLRRQLMHYIVHVPKIGATAVRDAIKARRLMTVGDDMETIAVQLRQEGLKEGRSEGKADILLKLLEQRFGTVPSALAIRVRAGSDADFDRWSIAIFGAPTIQDVFDG